MFGADIATLLFDHRGIIPHIGASGGIAGVMAALVLSSPTRRISHVRRVPGLSRQAPYFVRIYTPTWLHFLAFLATNLVGLGLMVHGEIVSISYSGHIGGSVVGALTFLFFKNR